MTPAIAPDATVLDVRPAPDFVRGHVPGALFVDFDRRTFLSLVRLLLPPPAAIALVTASREVAGAASAILVADGYQVGETDAGTERPLQPLPTIDINEVAERLAAPVRDFDLVDVRQSFEWKLGRIDGAVHVPLKQLPADLIRFKPDDEIWLVCEQGIRSATAASYLRRRGYTHVKSLDGGVAAWLASGRPLLED